MTNAWSDFNDAKQASNIIPKGTIAKVRMTLRPGGFDDPTQGWTGGYAKRGTTGSVYLDVEYTVLEGPYAKSKIWSMIGLYSPKGPDWAAFAGNDARGERMFPNSVASSEATAASGTRIAERSFINASDCWSFQGADPRSGSPWR